MRLPVTAPRLKAGASHFSGRGQSAMLWRYAASVSRDGQTCRLQCQYDLLLDISRRLRVPIVHGMAGRADPATLLQRECLTAPQQEQVFDDGNH
jgi:hypothetical protein